MLSFIAADAPLVTVVTVTYNSSAYVRDSIESVLAQTYENIQYIIGDDCSTDNTWQIISEYRDPRVLAYRNTSNLKEYANRNKAIELATGKYLIFIDGDDIIYPHGIAYFVSQIEHFPSVGLAIQKNYTNNVFFPVVLNPDRVVTNHFSGVDDLLSSSLASDFFKTEILRKIKFKTEFKSGDDEIRLRIATEHPILFIQGWVTWPRETPGQANSKISLSQRGIESFKYTNEILNGSSLSVELKNDILRLQTRRIARFILKRLILGNLNEALSLFLEAKLSFAELLKNVNYKSSLKNFLGDFKPDNPLRKES